MTDRDIVLTLNIIADQISSEGMTVRAANVRAGAIEITRLRIEVELLEKSRREIIEIDEERVAEVERLQKVIVGLREILESIEAERISKLGGIGSPA